MNMKELAKLKEEYDAKKAEADMLYEESGVKKMMEEVRGLENRLKVMLEEVGEAIKEWEPDMFDPAAMTTWDGLTGILRTTRSVRNVRTAEFIDAYPLVAARVATIPVGAAEKAVGAEELEKYVDRTTQYQFKLVTRKTKTKHPQRQRGPYKPRKLAESQRRVKVEPLGL